MLCCFIFSIIFQGNGDLQKTTSFRVGSARIYALQKCSLIATNDRITVYTFSLFASSSIIVLEWETLPPKLSIHKKMYLYYKRTQVK